MEQAQSSELSHVWKPHTQEINNNNFRHNFLHLVHINDFAV